MSDPHDQKLETGVRCPCCGAEGLAYQLVPWSDPRCRECWGGYLEAGREIQDEQKAELAAVREACPAVRQQRFFDASTLAIVEEEISRSFRLQSRAEAAERKVADQEAEIARLRTLVFEFENREAAVCPEDVGFEEVIARLRTALELKDQAWQVEVDSAISWHQQHDQAQRELAGERSARTQLEGRIRELAERCAVHGSEIGWDIGEELAALLAVSSPHLPETKDDQSRVAPLDAGADGQDPPRSDNEPSPSLPSGRREP